MVFWKVKATCFCPSFLGHPPGASPGSLVIPEPALLTDLQPVWRRWVDSETLPSTWDTSAPSPGLALMLMLTPVLTPDRLEACHPQRLCAKMAATEQKAASHRAAVCPSDKSLHLFNLFWVATWVGLDFISISSFF